MPKMRFFLSLCFSCLVAAAAHASSVNPIAITGSVYDGFATTYGDYTIQGLGLSLVQADLGGPSFIGSCAVGAVCNFTWSPASPDIFCGFCTRYTSGSLGSNNVQWLEPNLFFKGSAFYSGGNTLTMNFTVSGIIYGYELTGCTDGFGCTPGTQVFALKISGTGIETLTMNELDGTEILGLQGTFSGTATPVTTPEPGSLILMGTGLAGVWTKWRKRR